MKIEGSVALVTGAGGGIGRETALLLAERGANLVICDIDGDSLAEVAETLANKKRLLLSHPVDVADRDAMAAFAEAVHERAEAVDILVNNAGVGVAGGLLDMPLDAWDWVLGINLTGVAHGCHFFIPPMLRRKKGGHVVNVSSIAGICASRHFSAYAATKFGVFGLSEALREEVRDAGIGVTTICPAFVNTKIVERTRAFGQEGKPENFAKIVSFYQRRNYGPDRVARAIVRAVTRNRNRVVPVSSEAWLLYAMKHLCPPLVPLTIRWFERIIGLP